MIFFIFISPPHRPVVYFLNYRVKTGITDSFLFFTLPSQWSRTERSFVHNTTYTNIHNIIILPVYCNLRLYEVWARTRISHNIKRQRSRSEQYARLCLKSKKLKASPNFRIRTVFGVWNIFSLIRFTHYSNAVNRNFKFQFGHS